MNWSKNIGLRLVRELMRSSWRSDRELALLLGVSQPTVSRNRVKLEREGFLDYAAVPDLQKLGFDLMAITFGNWNHEQYPDTRISAAKDFVKEHTNLIFLSSGAGSGGDRVAITVHRDYSDYVSFIQEIESDWGKYMDVTESFLISLSSDEPLRSITFKHLLDNLEKLEHVS